MLIDIEHCPEIRQAYPAFASTTQKWLSSDNRDEYKKNLKKNKSLLDRGNWINKEIDYKINRYGFRCSEFTTEPGIVWLGCSYTSGIGVMEEKTFAYQVSKKLNLKNWNLSQAAGSNDTCFRIGSYWIPILKPKIVILVRPEISRFELINKHGTPEASPEREISKLWVLQRLNQQLQLERNISGLKYYTQQIGAEFYEFCGHGVFREFAKNDVNQNFPLHVDDLARDLMHPGNILHKTAAKKIFNTIQKVYT